MKPFIRNDQFNFIKSQLQILVNGHSTTSDAGVLRALESLSIDKVMNMFTELNEEQMDIINPITSIREKAGAEEYLACLKEYVIPFSEISDQAVKKLFPKARKLKAPSLDGLDLRELTYLGWEDKGTNRKYIITKHEGRLVGLHGTFRSMNQKGICSLCNRHEEVGMFLSEKKGASQDQFIKRGNYICQDSRKCNQNITSLDKMNDFIERLSR